MEELSLIDVSLEDDLLISSSSNRNRDYKSSESIDAYEEDIQVKINKQSEHFAEISESPKQKRSGKVNLRKSLAWDSAFFTSEGVLNTEELAIVNSTFRKIGACTLPGIQEELRRSTESTSTLDSESYLLENLEGDLFATLRVSIQKSVGKQDNCISGEPNESRLASKKKVERHSQAKTRPPIGLKMNGLIKRQLECTAKEVAMECDDSKLLTKPPRNVHKHASLPTIPMTKDSSDNGEGSHGIRAFSKANGESSNITSRSISSNGASSASHLAGKSSLEPKIKSSSLRNCDRPSTGSTTLVRASKANTAPSNISRPPTLAKSTFKFSSKASPSSSINNVILEASSSTSSSFKPSNSVESRASSTSSPSLAVPADIVASEKTDVSEKDISAKLLRGRSIYRTALGVCAMSEPPNRDARSCTSSNTGATKSFKLSGLRMPSPKIGYFDAEKTLICNSNKFSQIGLRKNDTVGANNPRAAAEHVFMKIDSLQTQLMPLSSHNDSSNVTDTGIQATYQFHKEENSGQFNSRDGHTFKEFRCISTNNQKENISPLWEINSRAQCHTEEFMPGITVLNVTQKSSCQR